MNLTKTRTLWIITVLRFFNKHQMPLTVCGLHTIWMVFAERFAYGPPVLNIHKKEDWKTYLAVLTTLHHNKVIHINDLYTYLANHEALLAQQIFLADKAESFYRECRNECRRYEYRLNKLFASWVGLKPYYCLRVYWIKSCCIAGYPKTCTELTIFDFGDVYEQILHELDPEFMETALTLVQRNLIDTRIPA